VIRAGAETCLNDENTYLHATFAFDDRIHFSAHKGPSNPNHNVQITITNYNRIKANNQGTLNFILDEQVRQFWTKMYKVDYLRRIKFEFLPDLLQVNPQPQTINKRVNVPCTRKLSQHKDIGLNCFKDLQKLYLQHWFKQSMGSAFTRCHYSPSRVCSNQVYVIHFICCILYTCVHKIYHVFFLLCMDGFSVVTTKCDFSLSFDHFA
jgi:hypothetical protein